MDPSIYKMMVGLIAVGGCLGATIYFVHLQALAENKRKIAAIEARHKERLALIEKGMDPLLADQRLPGDNSPKDLIQGILLWGMLLTGIGLGVFIGNIVDLRLAGKSGPTVYAGALLFGGLGLLGYYALRTRRGKAAKQPS
jgi:hypothetical protein